MANRSDREQGQPSGRSRHHSLLNEMGLSSRTPSGPAVLHRLHKQAEQRTAPDPTSDRQITLATREPSTENVCFPLPAVQNRPVGCRPSFSHLVCTEGWQFDRPAWPGGPLKADRQQAASRSHVLLRPNGVERRACLSAFGGVWVGESLAVRSEVPRFCFAARPLFCCSTLALCLFGAS